MLFYENNFGQLFLGDSKEILSTLPKESVYSCITSPPYWALRDYHTAQWEGGDPNCDHVKDPKATKVMGNPEFNKNRPSREATKLPGYYFDVECGKCGAKKIDRQLGQEPKFSDYIENLCLYFDEVWKVLRPDGTLWVNLGDTYYGGGKGVGTKSKIQLSNKGSYFDSFTGEDAGNYFKKARELPDKSLCLIPSRFAIAMQERGWILRNDIIWHKPNKFPESVKDRFTMDYEHIFMFSKDKKYYFEQQLEPVADSTKIRYKYGWNGKVEDGVAWAGNSKYLGSEKAMEQAEKGRNKRCVWSINTESKRGSSHFASYPKKLVETPILASCPPGGTVLDLFFGVGTTGIVAQELGRKWIGIDLNKVYCEEAVSRLEASLASMAAETEE